MTFLIPHSKPDIDMDEITAVLNILKSYQISEGCSTENLEKEIANFFGVFGALATSSGTHALYVALSVLDIKNKYVLMSCYSCRSLVDATVMAGGIPILIDVDDGFLLDKNSLKEIFNRLKRKNIGAIIAVHNFGFIEDVPFLKTFDVPVVEDCCHSIGAEKNGVKVGANGDLSIVSFHATKLLTTAEGGMVLTSSERIYNKLLEKCKSSISINDSQFITPMSNIHSAIGLVQLSRLDEFIKRRREISLIYRSEFSHFYKFIERDSGVVFREPMISDKAIQHLKILESIGVLAKKPVDPLLHHIFKHKRSFVHSERLFNTTLSLPLYPSLKDNEIDYIVESVKKINS